MSNRDNSPPSSPYWSVNQNENTSNSSEIIGTSSQHHLLENAPDIPLQEKYPLPTYIYLDDYEDAQGGFDLEKGRRQKDTLNSGSPKQDEYSDGQINQEVFHSPRNIPNLSRWTSFRSLIGKRWYKLRSPSGTYIFLKCVLLLLSIFVTIMFLFILSFIIMKTGATSSSDYSQLIFDYKVDLSDLVPLNLSFNMSSANVYLDAHSHTTYSDGSMSPEQLLQWAISSGMNAIVVTDHNTVKGGIETRLVAKEKFNDTIKVIVGEEYTCCRIHMNLWNIEKTIPVCGMDSKPGDLCPFPSDDVLKSVIQEVHKQGGLVIVNHIPWSLTNEGGFGVSRLPAHPSRQQLVDWGVDGFEILNADTLDYPTIQFANEWREKSGKTLLLVSGSDVHTPFAMRGWTVLRAEEPITPTSIMDAMKGVTSFSDQSILFDAVGRPNPYPLSSGPIASRSQDAITPLINLGDYIDKTFFYWNPGMYSFQNSFCQEPQFQIYFVSIVMLGIYGFLFFIFGCGLYILLSYCCLRRLAYGKHRRSIQKAMHGKKSL